MPTLTYPVTLIAGQPENVNDLNLILAAIQTTVNALDSANLANSAVTADKLGTALAQQLGVTNAANVGRGATSIAATEARTNVAYGTLTTPDQVASIVLPANGLIVVGFQAAWQSTVANAAGAAIFIGATQLKTHTTASASPVVQETFSPSIINIDFPLTSFSGGLATGNIATSGYTGDVTTGEVLGTSQPTNVTPSGVTGLGSGPVYIFAAAGTYTIGIQFKAASGTVTAKNRKLWVWSMGFS